MQDVAFSLHLPMFQGLMSAALSPDATMLVLVDGSGDVLLVDWAQSKEPRRLAASPGRVSCHWKR